MTPPPSRLLGRLRHSRPLHDPAIRTAAPLWLASKVAVLTLAWAASWIMYPARHSRAPLGWQEWDANLFRQIAQYGYFGPAGTPNKHQVAFFPGYPLVLRAVHLLIPSWVAAELTIATVASFFAVLALVRLAEDYQAGSGGRAALFFLAAPAAVFLSVGYSEALFLAFAIPSWRAARRESWTAASLLGAAACAIRANGLFFMAGIVLMAIRSPSGRRPSVFARLMIPAVPIAAYELYLRYTTGDWLAWLHAEAAGWGRSFRNPLATFQTTWAAAFGGQQHAPIAFMFELELASVAVLVLLTAMLLRKRQWPEAIYSLLTLAAMATGTWYESVPRAVLLLWPLWCMLGAAADRYRRAAMVWLAVSIPLMCVTAILYTSGNWAG